MPFFTLLNSVLSSSESDSARPAVCPVNHGQAPKAAVCPVNHGQGAAVPHGHGSAPSSDHSGPADGPDHEVPLHPFFKSKVPQGIETEYDSDLEKIPESSIPATNRGNSPDGSRWINPSPAQLYRALARRNKAIDISDAAAVAMVHEAVIDQSWQAVMVYENLHKDKCPNPALARFQGMWGKHSIKAQMTMRTSGLEPFDRHDWTVDRCGKEIRYILDYYSMEEEDPETGEVDTAYFIDARPALTFGGAIDRVKIAFASWRKGEKWY